MAKPEPCAVCGTRKHITVWNTDEDGAENHKTHGVEVMCDRCGAEKWGWSHVCLALAEITAIRRWNRSQAAKRGWQNRRGE